MSKRIKLEKSAPPAVHLNAPVFPEMDPGVRYASFLVKLFPRRIFRLLRVEHSKYVQDALVMKTVLREVAYPECAQTCQLDLLDDSVLAQMIAHPEGLPESVYRRRLAQGDICYIQKVDGTLVSYNWVSLTRCGTYVGFDKEAIFRALSDIQCFTYDFYTYKAYRNKGYGFLLKNYLLADLYRRGRQELLNCIEPTNDISLRIHFKLNYQLDSIVTNFRLMKWCWTNHSTPRRKALVENWMADYKAYHQL
jgi:GNAT superfamily N-acetyltransferase